MANASASGGGTAVATSVATGGAGGAGTVAGAAGAANATSNATTAKGALAQAQSTALGSSGQAQSTAKTTFVSVSVQSSAVAPTGAGTATTNAIAQGGSGSGLRQSRPDGLRLLDRPPRQGLFRNPNRWREQCRRRLAGAARRGFRDRYSGGELRHRHGGGASHTYSGSATFDFGYGGDLMLGLIDDQDAGFPAGSAFSRWNSPFSTTAWRNSRFDL